MYKVVSLIALCVIGCSNNHSTTTNAEAPTVVPVTIQNPPSEEKLSDRVMKAGSVREMLSLCTPLMSDKDINDEMNPGAVCAVAWSMDHLSLKDVYVQKDETSPGLVMKNSTRELGKRLCATGIIVQIQESGLLSEGLLRSYSGTLYHYANVGGSGALTEGMEGKLCGMVVGSYHYRNSMGGVGHAVDVVGRWLILSENHAISNQTPHIITRQPL